MIFVSGYVNGGRGGERERGNDYWIVVVEAYYSQVHGWGSRTQLHEWSKIHYFLQRRTLVLVLPGSLLTCFLLTRINYDTYDLDFERSSAYLYPIQDNRGEGERQSIPPLSLLLRDGLRRGVNVERHRRQVRHRRTRVRAQPWGLRRGDRVRLIWILHKTRNLAT